MAITRVAPAGAPQVSGSTNDEGYPVVSWTAVNGADYYIMYRAESANGDYYYWNETTGTTLSNASYTEIGGTYYYKISAVINGVEGPMSEAVAITRIAPVQ